VTKIGLRNVKKTTIVTRSATKCRTRVRALGFPDPHIHTFLVKFEICIYSHKITLSIVGNLRLYIVHAPQNSTK